VFFKWKKKTAIKLLFINGNHIVNKDKNALKKKYFIECKLDRRECVSVVSPFAKVATF
jgi:hypothetical protein